MKPLHSKIEKLKKKIDKPLIAPSHTKTLANSAFAIASKWSDEDYEKHSLEDLFCLAAYGLNFDQFLDLDRQIANHHMVTMFQEMFESENDDDPDLKFRKAHIHWDGPVPFFDRPSHFPKQEFETFGGEVLRLAFKDQNVNLMGLSIPHHAEQGFAAAKQVFPHFFNEMLENKVPLRGILRIVRQLFPQMDFASPRFKVETLKNENAWIVGQLLVGALNHHRKDLLDKVLNACVSCSAKHFSALVVNLVDFKNSPDISKALFELKLNEPMELFGFVFDKNKSVLDDIPEDVFAGLMKFAVKEKHNYRISLVSVVNDLLKSNRVELLECLIDIDFDDRETLMLNVLSRQDKSQFHGPVLERLGSDRIAELFDENVRRGNFHDAELLLPHVDAADRDARVVQSVWHLLDSKMPSVAAHFKKMTMIDALGHQEAPSAKSRKM